MEEEEERKIRDDMNKEEMNEGEKKIEDTAGGIM